MNEFGRIGGTNVHARETFNREQPSEYHAYTGERLSHGHNLQTELEHYHRYYLARDLARSLDVLDLACGEGYGSALLAQTARTVIGVDIDPEAVAHAARSHCGPNASFRQGSATAIPLEDNCIDLLVSFETLEHFVEHDGFFAEARRVLRAGGRLIVSTPDRDVYSGAGSEPNEFHKRELSRHEFAELARRYFKHVALYAQKAMVGSALLREDAPAGTRVFERGGVDQIEADDRLLAAPYLIAVASDVPLEDQQLPHSLLIETGEVSSFTDSIPWLRQEIAERTALQEALGTRASQAESALSVATASLDILRTELAMARRENAFNAGDLVELRVERAELLARVERDRLALNVSAEEALGLHSVLTHIPPSDAPALRAEIERLRAVVDQRDVLLAAIWHSTSWRLLGPLRRLARLVPSRARWLAKRLVRAGLIVLSGRIRHRIALRRQRAKEIAAIRGSTLFDPAFYRDAHPEIGGTDAVEHFVWLGAAKGFDPNPLFDLEWYRSCHPTLADGRINPLYHYLRDGIAAGADPHPLFHTSFYLAQLNDIGDEPALAHYLRLATKRTPGELRIPCPYFDPELYMAEHESARASGLDPLLHYLRVGAAAGLDPHPLFDTAYYLRQASAARAARLTPLGHFLREGTHLSPSPLLAPGEPVLPTPALHLRFGAAVPATDARGPDVSVIIPAYGHALATARCLAAIQRRTGRSLEVEIILADDCPDRPIAPLFAGTEGLRTTVNPRNLGFLRSCNAAARLARGRHLVFLNNDTLVHDDWLTPLVRLADGDVSVGMVGCRLLNADGTLQEAGCGILENGWGYPYGRDDDPDRGEYRFVREVDVVTGACFLVKRDVFRAVGGFDDRYAPAYYEEYDLAFAVRARGLRVLYQPTSQVTHFDASSYGDMAREVASIRNHAQFCRKWIDVLARQPSAGAAAFVWRARPAPGGTLLMVEDHVPEHDKHAGAQATLHYVRLMIRLGVRVVLWPYDGLAPQPYTRELEQMGVEVLCAPVRLAEWLVQNGRFIDHVWTARPVMTESVLNAVLAHTGAPVHYLTHDLHFLREERRHTIDGDSQALTDAATYRRIELGIFDRVDSIITFSEDEEAVIRSVRPHAVVRTAPLFFYDSIDTAPRTPAGRDTLLFVGGFRHVPNVDAALWLIAEIMPLVWLEIPSARLVIVGSDPPPELTCRAARLVEVRGHVADLAPLYAAAKVSINPLRFGAGVKGKIVNSLAEGLPVVTTAIGNEGLRLINGHEALIGETPEALASGIVSLWRDSELWRKLSAAGLEVIAQRFSEQAAETLLRELLDLPMVSPRT